MAEKKKQIINIAVMTSGGDAPGMNPAVRAVVRTAQHHHAKVYAVREGYRGLVEGRIDEAGWDYVSGVIDKGGTCIGTTRYPQFEQEAGKLEAALNLIRRGIDRLVVIGGDGSLTGAAIFSQQWPQLVAKLLAEKKITDGQAQRFTKLSVIGMVGSIDNDMTGTDYTIGTDTALQRISEAVDAISSTAASHQRIFVVKVMGRHCGYLALVGALITGSDWVLIPEKPAVDKDWKTEMIRQLAKGIDGKRATIVILAEGATDRKGNPIGSNEVKEALEIGLKKKGEEKADVRVTILGHVQRGGAPSAYDRILSTLQGYTAVQLSLSDKAFEKPWLIVDQGNKQKPVPLIETVEKNREITKAIENGDYDLAMELRGHAFKEIYNTAHILMKPAYTISDPTGKQAKFAIFHSGAPAPGMNAAVRAAVRLAMAEGFEMIGIERGFDGLIHNHTKKLAWSQLNGWASMGGAELGTSRTIPTQRDLMGINRTLEANNIKGLIMVGGWTGYEGSFMMMEKRQIFESFDIPIICIPSTISGNLPATESCIGSDTALNNILDAVDKIKQSAVAAHRCFVVEVSGRYCGYLALMSGLASGAERVYMHEQKLSLSDLLIDLGRLITEFRDEGRRVALMIRSQKAYEAYDTNFMTKLFNEESQGLFDAREAILGHLQHGGNPSPLDRVLATRFADDALALLKRQWQRKKDGESDMACVMLGMKDGRVTSTELKKFYDMVDKNFMRAKKPWWLQLESIAALLAQEPEF